MNIFKHETTIKTWLNLIVISLSVNIYLLFEREWLAFIISVPLGWIACMITYFGLEWIFNRDEVKL